MKPAGGQDLTIAAVVRDAEQKAKVERWAKDEMLTVKVVDLSSGIYALPPYNGNEEAVLLSLARYYAGEKGMSPIVARTLNDLLEVTLFLGIPNAQLLAVQAGLEAWQDLERYNL